jgi:hypothetical protein
MTCKRCGGALLSRDHLAHVLRRLRPDAERAAPDLEASDDPLLRRLAEDHYLDVGIEQVASELDGVCSACYFDDQLENEPKRWTN